MDSGDVTAAPGLLQLAAADDGISWAIYRVHLFAFENPLVGQIQGTLTTPGEGGGLWIGLSNYTRGSWEFEEDSPYDMSSQALFSFPDGQQYKSGASNAYLLLLAYDGDALDLSLVNFVTTIQEPPMLPPAWDQARINAGLAASSMGMEEILGSGLTANGWTWSGYEDLWTMFDVYWNAWYADPQQFPDYVHDKGEDLSGATLIQDLILAASDEFQAQHQIERQTHEETLDPTNPLAVAVADFVAAAGGTPDLPGYTAALQPLSPETQRALAPVIYAAQTALASRNQAMDDVGFSEEDLETYFNWTHGAWIAAEFWVPAVYDTSGAGRFMRGFPYSYLFEGAAVTADAIDDLTAYMQTEPTLEHVTLDVDTPVGKIVIGGTADNVHTAPLDGNGHAILIDLGGNDTYNCHAGGTASSENGVAICLDLGGHDIYNAMDDPNDLRSDGVNFNNDHTSQQGGARYGIGILVDYEGGDTYNSVRLSQGSAMIGVGVLADLGGDDIYTHEALGQGGAYGGIGILYDAEGEDQYSAYTMSQGYGGIMGVGFLVDQGSGADSYYAEPVYDASKPEYSSPQLPPDHPEDPSMSSFCQGAAFGLRWGGYDSTVGSGGLGICCDGGGDDEYTCGVFGQGIGFYQATGILIDQDGSDLHNGLWYTCGGNAHVAVAALFDGGGNDQYYNKYSVGIGGAHDWSVTWFLERAGDDTYDGASLDLGAGNANGMGYFIDTLGHDTYLTHGSENSTLGRGVFGGETREDQVTYGIFVDVAGDDTYDAKYANMLSGMDDTAVINPTPDDAASWVRGPYPGAHGANFYALEHGCGLDAE